MFSLFVDTKNLYRIYVASSSDIFWSDPEKTPAGIAFNENIMKGLATGDFNVIRNAFKDGNTVFLLPPDMMKQVEKHLTGKTDEDFKDDFEIRVYHKGQCIGVVIDRDIVF